MHLVAALVLVSHLLLASTANAADATGTDAIAELHIATDLKPTYYLSQHKTLVLKASAGGTLSINTTVKWLEWIVPADTAVLHGLAQGNPSTLHNSTGVWGSLPVLALPRDLNEVILQCVFTLPDNRTVETRLAHVFVDPTPSILQDLAPRFLYRPPESLFFQSAAFGHPSVASEWHVERRLCNGSLVPVSIAALGNVTTLTRIREVGAKAFLISRLHVYTMPPNVTHLIVYCTFHGNLPGSTTTTSKANLYLFNSSSHRASFAPTPIHPKQIAGVSTGPPQTVAPACDNTASTYTGSSGQDVASTTSPSTGGGRGSTSTPSTSTGSGQSSTTAASPHTGSGQG
eukprot:scpid91675/ scgid18389/ 